jgi:steroid delta-isomerase-like uncharacterized protein
MKTVQKGNSPMSTENNKAAIRRVYEEAISRGNMAVIDELVSPDYVEHDPNYPQPVRGPEGLKQYFLAFRSAFPDLHLTIEDIVGEGDTVAVRHTTRGTQKGDLLGIPPTGKQLTTTGMTIQRFVDGKLVETWVNADSLGMLQRLGVIPAPGQGS